MLAGNRGPTCQKEILCGNRVTFQILENAQQLVFLEKGIRIILADSVHVFNRPRVYKLEEELSSYRGVEIQDLIASLSIIDSNQTVSKAAGRRVWRTSLRILRTGSQRARHLRRGESCQLSFCSHIDYGCGNGQFV